MKVDDAISAIEAHTLSCIGPEQPFADSREWLCQHKTDDGLDMEVRIIGDARGVTQIVGIAHEMTADEAVSYLIGVVASLMATDVDGEHMRLWAAEHTERGRTWELDGLSVRLQPHSTARAVVVTARDSAGH